MNKQKNILIIGAGSVGKRHAANFKDLGFEISAFDPRMDRINEIKQKLEVKETFSSLKEALKCKYDGAVVASPTAFHVEQAIELISHNIPVLLEKPLSKDLDSSMKIKKIISKTNVPVLLGYTWRWWEPLCQVRKMIKDGVIGKIIHVRMSMAVHLADWHPWENYKDFFMASKELGGGALLDESHWIDLMIWFFGMPSAIFAKIDSISGLDIETDDNVDIIGFYNSGPRVSLHLDLYCRPHEKTILFSGEKGTIKWTVEPNRIAVGKTWEDKWDFIEFNCQRNDMFKSLARDFVKVMAFEKKPSCTIDDGVNVMKIIETARISSLEGKIQNVI